MWDAVIAGAGPAGAVAALVLARRQLRVLLVDLIDPDRQKVGEAIPGAAVRLLHMLDLPVSCSTHIPNGGNLSSWNSEELIARDFIQEPDGLGFRLDRLRFDATLREVSIRSGAVFRSARVSHVKREGTFWRVAFTDGGMVLARWLLDATGRWAAVARQIGARRLREVPLVGLYASGNVHSGNSLNRTVIEAAPNGWWYAAVLPSGAPVAGLHLRPRDAARVGRSLSLWRTELGRTRHIARLFPNAFCDPLRAFDASGARLDHFEGYNWLACGDAALSFDPISGQGIFSALHGGMTAAFAVTEALAGCRVRLEAYVSQLEQIWRIYSARRRAIYHSETRWGAEYFWSSS
jgi:flavin-dependent dehydrogenase